MAVEPALLIELADASLPADVAVPPQPHGLVVFAHGSGSSRRSARNRHVAATLQQRGFATLLIDLLTEQEDQDYKRRFNIPHLSQRLRAATDWLRRRPEFARLPLVYFGASTGAAAAIEVAAELGETVSALVLRGGRPDLASPDSLARLRAPTLLIVGGHDDAVIAINQNAYAKLRAEKDLAIVPGATHLFEEPGALDEVARRAGEWFERYCVVEAAS